MKKEAMKNAMPSLDTDPDTKYLRVIRWARRRYADNKGKLVVWSGNEEKSPYMVIERSAWKKWMA